MQNSPDQGMNAIKRDLAGGCTHGRLKSIVMSAVSEKHGTYQQNTNTVD